MKYFLDTNICVHFLRGKFNLDQKLRAVGIENCAISEITVLELEYGIENSDVSFQPNQRIALENFIKTFNNRILPIRSCFSVYAKQRVRLRKLGTPISDFDLLISSTALTYNSIMVTDNIKEFNRIENIKIENWVER